MIQGAINQLLAFGAAAKRAGDLVKQKDAKIEAAMQKAQAKSVQPNRASMARDRALQRMKEGIQNKYNQNKEYQAFVKSLGNNQAPDIVKQVAFDAMKRRGDMPNISAEARSAFKGGMR